MTPPTAILLVGAGGIGRRHLQALTLADWPLAVTVVEPEPRARARAEADFKAAPAGPVRAVFQTALPRSGHFDQALVATCSRPRAALVEEIVGRNLSPALILEKVLFPRLAEYDRIEELLEKSGARAWVNCPRRLYPIYQDLRPHFQGRPLTLKVDGGPWGLACNSIHFVDLLAFFSGEHDFHWDLSSLDPEPRGSQRSGYLDFTGRITISGPGGAGAELVARAAGQEPLVIELQNHQARARMDESAGQYRLDLAGAPSPSPERPFTIPYQSQLTHLACRALARGDQVLTDYARSARLHRPMIAAFTARFKAWGFPADEAPVT